MSFFFSFFFSRLNDVFTRRIDLDVRNHSNLHPPNLGSHHRVSHHVYIVYWYTKHPLRLGSHQRGAKRRGERQEDAESAQPHRPRHVQQPPGARRGGAASPTRSFVRPVA